MSFLIIPGAFTALPGMGGQGADAPFISMRIEQSQRKSARRRFKKFQVISVNYARKTVTDLRMTGSRGLSR